MGGSPPLPFFSELWAAQRDVYARRKLAVQGEKLRGASSPAWTLEDSLRHLAERYEGEAFPGSLAKRRWLDLDHSPYAPEEDEEQEAPDLPEEALEKPKFYEFDVVDENGGHTLCGVARLSLPDGRVEESRIEDGKVRIGGIYGQQDAELELIWEAAPTEPVQPIQPIEEKVVFEFEVVDEEGRPAYGGIAKIRLPDGSVEEHPIEQGVVRVEGLYAEKVAEVEIVWEATPIEPVSPIEPVPPFEPVQPTEDKGIFEFEVVDEEGQPAYAGIAKLRLPDGSVEEHAIEQGVVRVEGLYAEKSAELELVDLRLQ